MIELVLATRNRGKVSEFRQLLGGLPLVVLAADDLPGMPDVEETGTTFAANAALKATAIAAASGRLALADDSGLEVEALGGAPGVHSARYAGPGADDAANRAKLLGALAGVPPERRTARFRCAVALANPHGLLHTVVADWAGTIALAERGSGGFGYDSIFIPDGETRTAAELTTAEKNSASHRAQALQQTLSWLQQWLQQQSAGGAGLAGGKR